MNRRDFFTVNVPAKAKFAEPIVAPPASPAQDAQPSQQEEQLIRPNSGINPYAGTFGDNELVHLLKRTLFGSRKADVDLYRGKTMSQVVDLLLTAPNTVSSTPVKNYSTSTTPATDPDMSIAAGASWVNNYSTYGQVNNGRTSSYKSWWMGLMLNQQPNILEKMVLFWHNHFATQTTVVQLGVAMYRHNVTLRKYALGNFRQFVKAISIDPAMLRYLNGEKNTKKAPDENYARELQELFTVGKVGTTFTETDVQQAAKVLTGYKVNYADVTSAFDITKHDTTNKTFSSFYGNKIITGKLDATGGAAELDEMLDMIFLKEEVSKFIVRKLYRWFVYYDIDSTIETNVIAPLALIFRQNNYEIKPVLSALFKSEHFYDVLNQGCMIKSPVDMVVGAAREYNSVFPAATDYVNAYYMWAYMAGATMTGQQSLGDPPNVAGWPAYYQVPQYHELWINSDILPKRTAFTDVMITLGYSRQGKTIIWDPIAFAKTTSNPGDPNVLINESLIYLYRVPLTQTTRDQIKKDILLTGQVTDSYWTSAWNAYIATPTDKIALKTVSTRLNALYKYLMDLVEYQLM